jgi:hypothetical protein
MNIDFEEILKELEYRLPHGIINLNEEHQVTMLVQILRENGVDDANRLAQKARVIFGYVNEADVKNNPLDKEITYTGKDKKQHKIKIGSGLGYDKKHPGYIAAVKSLESDKVSPEKIKGLVSKSKNSDKPKGTPVFDTTGKDVFSKEKGENKKKKEYKPTTGQIKTFTGRKSILLEVVEKGLLGKEEKITKGVGVFEPTDDELKAIIDVTKRQLKDPSYRLKLPQYDIQDEDIDIAVGIVKNKLGKDYKKWEQRVTKSGAVDTFLTTGESGKKRFRAIVKKYLETGGRSAITGKFVPFNHMQLDHHVPFSSAKQAVEDKTAKGIKTTIEDEKRRLDSPENWDLMETRINQHKNSLEGNELLEKSLKKYNRTPEEKELKKIKDEIKTIARDQLFTNLIKSFGKDDYSGFTEQTIGELNSEDQQMVAKAWNYVHPNLKERDTQNFLAADPDYPNKLKKLGIDINKQDPHFIVRYKAQVGGSRTRSLPKKPDLMRKDMIIAMKKAGILMSKKESVRTDTALAKAILEVEKTQKKLKDREKELKGKLKQQQIKNK